MSLPFPTACLCETGFQPKHHHRLSAEADTRIQLPSVKPGTRSAEKISAVPLINFCFWKHGYVLSKNVIYANMQHIFLSVNIDRNHIKRAPWSPVQFLKCKGVLRLQSLRTAALVCWWPLFVLFLVLPEAPHWDPPSWRLLSAPELLGVSQRGLDVRETRLPLRVDLDKSIHRRCDQPLTHSTEIYWAPTLCHVLFQTWLSSSLKKNPANPWTFYWSILGEYNGK